MRKVNIVVPVLAATALALTACSGGGTAASGGTTSSGAAFDWPATGTPGGGGNLTIVTNNELLSLEPGEAGTSGQGYPVLRNVLQTLLTRDSKTNDLKPLLATDYKSVDDLHWTFTLRQGVKWQDGTALNADTAAASLTYIWRKDVPYAGNFVADPVKFTAIDANTLGMELTKPDPLIPAKMTIMPLASPTQIKDNPASLPTKVIGTGPYKLVSYSPGSEVKLALNADYFDLHPGMFDTVDWIFRKENQVRAQLVQTKEADVAFDVTAEQCAGAATGGARCLAVPANGVQFLRPDFYNQTMLADPRIRQAIAHGVDRQGITSAFISKDGKVADNPAPPGGVGYVSDIKSYAYDPELAKKLVAEAKAAGVDTSIPITIKYRVGYLANIDDSAQTVATNLNAIGLTAKVDAMQDAEGLAQYRQNFEGNTYEKIAKDRAWIFYANTANELFDFSQFGDTLLTCKGKFSVYCDPSFEKKYSAAKLLIGDARQKAFADLWTSAYESTVPVIPISQPVKQFVLSGRVQVQPQSNSFLPLTEARAARS